MEIVKLYPALAFAAGLMVTLFLAAYLTPRGWWRRPNARALLIMIGGAWGLGSLILYAAQGTPALAATPARQPPAAIHATAAAAGVIAGQPFQVHRALNLRVTAGTDSPRMIVVPAGATVTPTGVRSGDWWQIKASVAGRESTGWVSSLWLRRSGE
jgi:hypothetical protein